MKTPKGWHCPICGRLGGSIQPKHKKWTKTLANSKKKTYTGTYYYVDHYGVPTHCYLGKENPLKNI